MNDGWLVYEPAGCRYVTREGALIDATCAATKTGISVAAGGRSAKYAIVSHWVVSERQLDAKPFARRRSR